MASQRDLDYFKLKNIPKPSYYEVCDRLGYDLSPFDWSILDLLLGMSRRGGRNAFGLSAKRIARELIKRIELGGMKRPSLKLREVLERLKSLRRLGLVYFIEGSPVRWFPSPRLIVACEFARGTQRGIEEYLW